MKLSRKIWIIIPLLTLIIVIWLIPARGGFSRMTGEHTEETESAEETDTSVEPVVPEEPETPEESETPDELETPGAPEQPEEPELYDDPEVSDEPEVSEEHGMSDEPGEPEENEVPEEPFEPENHAAPIMPFAQILGNGGIVVYTFGELRDALTGGDYTHIYLGDDITMTGGITVSSAKTSFTIDGINPLEPDAGRHTLTEFSSNIITNTIYINNSSTTEAALKNLIITGKNFFGTIGVAVLYNVSVTYENINYTGPQIAYNRAGTCRFVNCVINVATNHGSLSTVEELCEAHHVVFGGNVTVNGTTSISMMWFLGTGGTLTVLDHATVHLTSQNSYIMFSDSGPVNCTIGRGASVTVNSRYGMFYNNSATLHQFGTLSIGEAAALEVHQSAREAITQAPTIKARGNITVATGARLIVSAAHASADPLIRFMTGSVGAVFSDPDYVALSNTTGKLFDWQTGSGTVSVTADTLCYWTNAYTPQEAAAFEHAPDLYHPALTGVTLNIPSLGHMLTFGRLQLIPDEPEADSGLFTASAPPHTYIKLEHSSFETPQYGQADGGGFVSITVPTLDYPGEVRVTAQHVLLFKDAIATVRPPQLTQVLEFTHVPEFMPFGVVPIKLYPALYRRTVPEWTIVITDTRDFGSEWSLQVLLSSPLTGERGDTLADALILDGHVLDDEAHPVASGVKDTPEHTLMLKWTPDDGIMLQTPGIGVYAGSYTATLLWILVDGP